MSPRKPDDAESRGDAGGPLFESLPGGRPIVGRSVTVNPEALYRETMKGNAAADAYLAKFDGATISPQHDTARLNAQLRRVRDLVIDGQWRTLREIAAATGDPEASVSARLRDLRKLKFGGWTVKSRRRGDEKRGIHEYRCSP